MIDNTSLEKTNKAIELWIETREDRYFTIIYNSYQSLLLHYVKRIVHDEDIAYDITQEAFVSVFKNIHQYDPSRGKFSTWIYNIAKNAALSHINHETKQKNLRENLSRNLYNKARAEVTDEGSDNFTIIEKHTGSLENNTLSINNDFKNLVQITLQEIMNLNDKYRDFMFDREIRNLSYEEIATRYSVNLNTVKSKIRLGREIIMFKLLQYVKDSNIDTEALQSIISIKNKRKG
jgi:RNA polymerase sigma factor (sigma-70 family)